MEATALLPSLREEIVRRAKFAYLANRYEEMLKLMKRVAVATDVLTVEERNLLSDAYNHVIDSLHDSRRLMSWILPEKNLRETGSDTTEEESVLRNIARVRGITEEESVLRNIARVRDNKLKIDDSTKTTYKSEIESEISSFCQDILLLLNSKLIPSASDDESKIFYLKMRGDFWHRLADLKNGADRDEAAANALSDYQLAQELANAKLGPTNQVWLELAANFSDFYTKILNSPDRAFELSRQAYEEAWEELKTWEKESSMKFMSDNHHTMLRLRWNVTGWASNKPDYDPDAIFKQPPNCNEEQPRLKNSGRTKFESENPFRYLDLE